VNSRVDVYVAGTPRVVVSVIVVVLATNIHCVQVPPGVTDEQGVVLDVEVALPQYSVEDTFWLTKTDVMFALEVSGWVELVAELFLGIEGSGINARAALDVVVALTSKAIAAAELDVFAPLDVLVMIAVAVSPSPDKATSTKLMTDSPGVAELETLAKLEVLLVIEGVGAGAIPMPISTPPSSMDLEDVVTTEGLPTDTEVVNEELALVEAIGLTKTGGSKTGGSKTGGNTSAGAALVD